MPNTIKYSLNTEPLSLKKGDFYIGTGDVGKGPSESTGFYNGITPPVGGYVIYTNKESNGPSIRVANNDSELINITNSIANTSYTSATQCLVYFASQTDKMVVNRDYEGIVTDGLVLNLDAGFTPSYPQSGLSIYNNGSFNTNGSLVNGTSYSGYSGGILSFDGIDDVINLTSPLISSSWTLSYWGQFNVQKIKTNQYYSSLMSNNGSLLGRNTLEFTYSVTVATINTDSDGNIYIGGRICEYNDTVKQLIVKLDSSGNIINTFSPNLSITQTQDTTDIEFDSSNNLYYGGYNIGNLTKLNSTTGSQIQQIQTVNASITQSNIVLDESNNKVYIGGWFTSIQGVAAQRIARLNLSTMTIDTSFNTTTGFVNTEDVQMIVIQPDGKLIVGGAFTTYKGVSYNRIIRLNSDASIDTSFVIGSGFNSRINRNCIALQSDGKIIIGGEFITYNNVTNNRIVRLNSDGSIDDTFITGTGFNNSPTSIKVLPDGKILIVGYFSSYNGTTSNYIIRLNSNGTKDTTFNTGGVGANASILSLHIQSDNKILIGGNFTTYNNITANQLCRLNSDGTLDTSFSSGTGVLGAYRLNNQITYKNTPTTFTTQYLYNITTPVGYNWYPFQTASLPLNNKFFNYTLTKNSNGLYTQYWNGVQVQTANLSGATDTSLNINVIGTLKGYLGNLSVYSKPLTSSEVLQNYNAQKTRFGL